MNWAARRQLERSQGEAMSREKHRAVRGRWNAWKTWIPAEELTRGLCCHPAEHDGTYDVLGAHGHV